MSLFELRLTACLAALAMAAVAWGAEPNFRDLRAAARVVAKTDAGRTYVLHSIPFTREFHNATRRTCGRMPTRRPVQLVLIIDAEGTIERIAANSRTRKARCYIDHITGRSMPPPPKAPYPLELTFK